MLTRVPGHVVKRIIQFHDNHLGVGMLKDCIPPSVLDDEVKIPDVIRLAGNRTHIGVGAADIRTLAHAEERRLEAAVPGALRPKHELPRALAIHDMRSVHDVFRIERAVRVLVIDHDDALVLPVIEVLRGVERNTVMPHAAVFPRRVAGDAFFILAVPVEGVADSQQRAAVRLNALAVRIVPGLAGSYFFIHGESPFRCIREWSDAAPVAWHLCRAIYYFLYCIADRAECQPRQDSN